MFNIRHSVFKIIHPGEHQCGADCRAKKKPTGSRCSSIGRWLREEYDTAQPLPDRLAALVRKIEQSTERVRRKVVPNGAAAGR